MHLFRFTSRLRLAFAFLSLGLLAPWPALGTQQTILLHGVGMTLEDVTSQTAVYYTSMRLNRALHIWNVEVSVSNLSAQALSGPLVLVVDSARGTSGLLQPDGSAGASPAVDLSPRLTQNVLLSGQISAHQTLSFGVSTGSPSLTTRVFALPPGPAVAVGFVRTLDQAGQPLGSVTVQESGPLGSATNQTDAAYGAATLGSVAGQYTWMFSTAGYLPVWRRQTLDTNGVALIAFPRLSARSTNALALSPLESGVLSNSSLAISFSSGAVNSSQSATLTPLTPQTLPCFLPSGWSPLQAFWLEMPGPVVTPPAVTMQLWDTLNPGETGALVTWNSQAFEWDVVQLIPSTGGSVVTTSLPGAGAYAFVVGDAAPGAPPAPQANQPLAPASTFPPNLTTLSASGFVTPNSSPASLNPALVTGTAAISVSLSNGLATLTSGLVLECDVREQYQLLTGTAPVTPPYANYIAAYQRPGTNGAAALQATFPIRPLRLFSPARLSKASVSVDVLTPDPFAGVLLSTNGGQMLSGPVQLLAPAGALASPQAMVVTSLNPSNFVSLATNLPILGAFDVTATGLLPGNSLAVQLENGPTNSLLVAALVLSGQGVAGLEPVARFATDSQGRMASLETNASAHLPGITGSGLYVLLQVAQPQALVQGIALNSQAQPAGGLVASLGPWTALSRSPDGQFQLIAPAGTNQVAVTDLATGDSGQSSLTIAAGQAEVTPTVGVGLAGLLVVSTSPTNNAINVPQVTSITVAFNRPLNPATLTTNTAQLLEGGQTVPISLSLDGSGMTATVLPNTQLDSATNFVLLLSTNIADATGRPLQGQTQFAFATVPLSTRDPAAELIIYQPGATNVPANVLALLPGFVPGSKKNVIIVQGTPGVADPGVPVIIVDEASGVSTTVLSESDGSFASSIPGDEQDLISATFVGLNGTRIYTPVNRQLFDDGSVGLYPSGGALQAQLTNGPVIVTVPPNAVTTRTKFKLAAINATDLQTQLGGVIPTNGVVASGALNLHLEGPIPTLPLSVKFPVDLLSLGYPTNEYATNAAAVLAVVLTNSDVPTFRVMDQMLFTPNAATSQVVSAHSPTLSIAGSLHQPRALSTSQPGSASASAPKPKGSPGGVGEQVYAGALDTGIGLTLSLLPGGSIAQNIMNSVIVPIMFGPRPVVIKGLVGSVPAEVAIALEQAGVLGQVLNLQMGSQTLDIPYVSDGVNLASQLGYIKNPIAPVAQVFQMTLQAFQLAELAIAKPLSGAFITVALSGGPLVAQPGRIFPGMVYATSGDDGTFLTVAPAAGAQYLVTCTHPLFQDVQQEPANPISGNFSQGELTLAGAVFKNFLFTTPLLSQLVPSVNVAIAPPQPAAGQPCQVQVTAFLPPAVKPPLIPPPGVSVGLLPLGTTNLITGLPVSNPYGVLTNISFTTNGNTVTYNGTLWVGSPVTAVLKVFVAGATADQNFGPAFFTNQFSGATQPVVPTNIPKPDTNDIHGPFVVQTTPVQNGFVGDDSTITVTFDKPIDASVSNNLSGVVLSMVGGSPVQGLPAPTLKLSADQLTLSLQYLGLQPGQSYTLTLSGQSIRDLVAKPLNQLPSSTQPASFTLNFRTPPLDLVALTGPNGPVANGHGSVISGNRLYVLDQEPQVNYLLTYDLTIPTSPRLIGQTSLFGLPRDLIVVPQFRYVQNVHGPVQTNDLVVVVGGNLDAIINQAQGTTVTEPGQYLWVMNMSNPANPQILASPIVSYRVGSAVTKVRWAPPYLVYEEFGSDIQLLGLVNLQEMLIGYGSTSLQQSQFPPDGKPGIAAADGSYVDSGNYPIPPASPPEFYGLDQNFVLQGTTQGILDFSVTPGAHTIGITLSDGVQLDKNNNPTDQGLDPGYRTLVYGTPLNFASPTDAYFDFGPTAYPRWVTVFDELDIQINGAPVGIAAALVSLEPATNGLQTLAVLDISQPEQPTLVNQIAIPTTLLGGNIQSVTLSSDGRLQVAGNLNVVLLDPSALAVTNYPSSQLHPAIVGLIPSAGGITRSLGSSDYGVYAVADSGRDVVVQTAPQLSFVSFPQSTTGLVDPTLLHITPDANVAQILAGMRTTSDLAPARVFTQTNLNLPSDLEPPNPALHFYVLMTAPGGNAGANMTVELGLESCNVAGLPLSNLGQGFAPVRAISDNAQNSIGQVPRPNCGAPIRSLTAYRMSDNPQSPYYNFYLSRPFALITEAVQLTDLARIKGDGGPDREILFSGYALRAFIDPIEKLDSIVGPFSAQADLTRKVLFPVATTSALTVNRSYLTGDNPPPTAESSPMEDSYGTVQSHSGELRSSDLDMALPSPRMPINIVRTSGNQDNYEGPFGVGWEFNYNQRLTVLDPLIFPQGLQMALVVRDTPADSEVASAQDVLFHTGMGETYHFTWDGTNMPSEYAQDPLVQDFDYKDIVSDYYLPQHGDFDLLVRLKSGGFERLTSDGMRYRYRRDGRLTSIIDRYPINRHDLTYDPNDSDKLVRIDDYSVSGARYILFGYYRFQATDPSFTTGLDMNTPDPFVKGKICRLLDYAGGDVLFQYTSDGFLTNRLGMQVNGENGGFAGRSQTLYSYTGCTLTGIAVTSNGIPVISAVNVSGNHGKPVAIGSTGSKGNNQYTIAPNNSAANLAGSKSSVKLGDGTSTQRQFDKRGYVNAMTVMGTNGPPATAYSSNTIDGLTYLVLNPEGDSRMMGYDTNNPILRSRANLKTLTVNPGTRGGQGFTETFNYDARYNLQSGDQVDANGFHVTYTLTPDSRDIQTVAYGNAGSQTSTYNANGQRTHTVDQNGVQNSTEFDPATGFVLSQTSGDITYTYAYDGSYASQYGRPASISPPTGTPTTFTYNNELHEVEVVRGGLITEMAYDELGHCTYHQQQVGDGKQWTSRYSYDDKGFVTNLVTAGIEVNGVETTISYTYTPDARSRLQSTVFPGGAVQTYTYDDRGNVSAMTLGNYTESYDHDLNNNLTTITQGGDLVTVYQYDGLDRATNVITKTGTQDEVTSTSYYQGGEAQSITITDPQFGVLQQQTIDGIDALGRPLQVTSHGTVISPQYQYSYAPLSNSVSGPRMTASTMWDTSGGQVLYTDPNLTMSFKRDSNGRIIETDRHEDGATYSQFFTFDDLDHQITLADLLGTEFTYVPRADGNNLQIINARSHTTALQHTALGELLHSQRADGMEVVRRHDPDRQVLYEGDPSSGFNYLFDNQLRLTNSTLRNGAAVTYAAFDPRNMPTSITIPGGIESRQFDLQKQLLQDKITYQSTKWEEDYTYDGLGRARVVTYTQNGGPANTETLTYDPAGPMVRAEYKEDGADFVVRYSFYSDGTRQSVTYPSGVTVTDTRDATGRLTALSDTNGNIVSALSWAGNDEPRGVQLGSTILITNFYDVRGRLSGTRATRPSDGAVLAHMRYQFDGANNLQIRQYVHRGGRADVFGFDSGERVAQAQMGVLLTNLSGSGTALYQRAYSYDPTGLDFLTSATPSGPLLAPPPFATNWSAQDSFLLPERVDSFARGLPDPLGNVVNAFLWVRPAGASSPQGIGATIQHDGHGRLLSVTRTDGVTIQNQYQAGGLRFSRKVFQGAQLLSYSAYVYDSASRLLEEYDRTGSQPVLIARYYYASSHAPVAADLPPPGGGPLQRYYFLRDTALSIIAVADKNGNVVERAWFDTFGQPSLERHDSAPPVVNQIASDAGGALLISMSESVIPSWVDPGPGGGIVPLPDNLQSAFTFEGGITGAVTLVSAPTNAKPFSVLRFTPSQAVTGTNTLILNAGILSDEWANTNASQSFLLTNLGAPAGTVFYTAAAQSDTSPAPLARSDVSSPFLFQGQYMDYDTGLFYLRARFYDPYSGMFFEPDPMGYEDSVNHYAGLANNPVSLCDPTGLMTKRLRRFLKSSGYHENEMAAIQQLHPHLSKLGLSDMEIAAHVRVMMRRLKNNGENWEIGIRKFGNPKARLARLDEGYPQKPEDIENKSSKKTAIVVHTDEHGNPVQLDVDGQKHSHFVSDIDTIYFKRNGEFASYESYRHFQSEVNNEVDRLRNPSGNSNRVRQDPYQHGASFSIPEQFGLPHRLSTKGDPGKGAYSPGYFGKEAWLHIASKMKKGPGESFALSISKEGKFNLDNLSVGRVDKIGRAAMDDFKSRFTPGGKRFEQRLFDRINGQAEKDGIFLSFTYPWQNKGGVQ